MISMMHGFPTTPIAVGAGRPLACKKCDTYITSSRYMLSCAYRGFLGKAALYREVSSTTTCLSPPTIQLMASGAHTVRTLTCQTCNSYLGMEIVRAYESSERWKEGRTLLELESIAEQRDIPSALVPKEFPPPGLDSSVAAQNGKADIVLQERETARKKTRHVMFRRTMVILEDMRARIPEKRMALRTRVSKGIIKTG